MTVNDADSKFIGNGPLVPDDLEVGLDVDEADGGSVDAAFVGSELDGYFDEGVDLNELGDGGINARFVSVTGTVTVDRRGHRPRGARRRRRGPRRGTCRRPATATTAWRCEVTEDGSLRIEAVGAQSALGGRRCRRHRLGAASARGIRLVGSSSWANADWHPG